jgi:hypothetical protein
MTYLTIRQLTADNCEDFGGRAFIGQWYGNIIDGSDEYAGELYASQAEAIACMQADAAAMGMTDIILTFDE